MVFHGRKKNCGRFHTMYRLPKYKHHFLKGNIYTKADIINTCLILIQHCSLKWPCKSEKIGSIFLWGNTMCLHELLVFIRSVLLKQISGLSLPTALWFIAHRRHLAQHGFLSDETKMKYTWKSHFMHPSHSPGDIVLKKERKIRKEHTNPPEMCAECVSGSHHQLQPHRAV